MLQYYCNFALDLLNHDKMNDLLLSLIHESLSVIEDTCNDLLHKETHDFKEVYQAAQLIEHHAKRIQAKTREEMGDALIFSSSVKENATPFLQLVANATKELMESGNADINHVADKLAISPSMLRRKLSASTNFTPSNYLLYLRIGFSKHYLALYPDVTIIDTAYRCGFSDNSYFTNVFHRFTGLTPLQYIKSRITPPICNYILLQMVKGSGWVIL